MYNNLFNFYNNNNTGGDIKKEKIDKCDMIPKVNYNLDKQKNLKDKRGHKNN